MNERIRALMEKSGLQPYYDDQEKQIEKFAKLLIKDCLGIVQTGRLKARAEHVIATRIKEHFGVK